MRTNVQVKVNGDQDLIDFLVKRCEKAGIKKYTGWQPLICKDSTFGIWDDGYSICDPDGNDYCKAELVSLDEFLANLAVQPIEIQLNDAYKAVLTKDGITVGCQKFPLDVIEKLVKAKKRVEAS